jgi:hypothetical protein
MYPPITIIETPNIYTQVLYLGERSRTTTLTDVKFITSTRILVGHRYAGKLYLIDIIGDSYIIRHTLEVTRDGKRIQTEAFVVVGDTVYMIDYTEYLYCIKIKNNILQQIYNIKLNNTKTPYHGVFYHESHLYLTPSSRVHTNNEPVVKFDLNTHTILSFKAFSSTFRYKSLAILPNNNILLLLNYKAYTTYMTDKGHMTDSAIHLYSPSFELLDSKEIRDVHFDYITVANNYFYATGANKDGGFIYWGNISDRILSDVNLYPVEDFPHGITIHNDILAYTSYTTSTVYFIPLYQIHATQASS